MQDFVNCSLAVVGIGGLGCPVLKTIFELETQLFPPQIAAIHINCFDMDTVEASNLNRQILFSPADLGQRKTEAAQQALQQYRSPHSRISTHFHDEAFIPERFTANPSHFTCILECSDSPLLKRNVSRHARHSNCLVIYGAAQATKGLCLPIFPTGPCLECAFGELDEEALLEMENSCQQNGALGTACGMTALAMVEALSLGISSFLHNRNSFPHRSTAQLTTIDSRVRGLDITASKECALGCSHFAALPSFDLRSWKCPETFMYSKIALEEEGKKGAYLLFSSLSDMIQVSSSLTLEGFRCYPIESEDNKILAIPS